MREYIKKQLLALELAKIEYYDEVEHFYFIPKYSKPSFQLNKMYLISVSDEAATDSNATVPTHTYLKAYVTDIKDTSIYIDAVAVNPITKQDLNYFWSGWIKEKYLTQIAVL